MHLLIAAMLAAGWFAWKMPGPQLVLIFLSMELGAIIGAWWGARIVRKLERRDTELPLNPPR